MSGSSSARAGTITAVTPRHSQAPALPCIAFVEWIEPMMSGGNWMPELIAAAGGENLFGAAGKHSGYMQIEGS